MAFIDKLGEKITSGANAVSNSTKRMTETAKINSEISSNKGEIDKRMKKIGLCVKARLMSQINDPEIEQLAREIDEFINRNEQLANELKALKGIRHCEGCGAEISYDCVYCPSCGAKNNPSASNTVKSVKVKPHTAAAAPAPASDDISQYAPKPVNEPQPAVQASAAAYEQPVIPQNSAPSTPAAVFCTACGYKETPDAIFCSNCGTKLVK